MPCQGYNHGLLMNQNVDLVQLTVKALERVRFWQEYVLLFLKEKLSCDWLGGVHFHAKIVHIQELLR